VEQISDLPMLNDIDADYTPQYVKLARVLRDKIEASRYQHGDSLPAARLAKDYQVSVQWPGTRWQCSAPIGTSTVPAASPPTR